MEAVNLTVSKWSDLVLEQGSLLLHHAALSNSGVLNYYAGGRCSRSVSTHCHIDHHGSSSSSSFSSIIQLFWAAVLFSVANLVFQTLNWKVSRLPPCPSLWDVLYHFFLRGLLIRQRSQEDFFYRIARNYGGVIRLSWVLGNTSSQPAVLISSAAAAEEFFTHHDVQFGTRPSYMAKAMWGPRAPYWRHLQLILDVTSPSSALKFCGACPKGLEWATAAIRQHPEAVARVRSELECVVGLDRLVEESDIPKLPYLQAVVKELFRLHPPAPFSLPHELVAAAAASELDAECNPELLGYDIQAQTQVFINIYAINRDPSVWDRPNEFDPDRFLKRPEIDLVGKHFMLLPFGAGRRQCPGARVAILFVQLGLANQLHTWYNSSLRFTATGTCTYSTQT